MTEPMERLDLPAIPEPKHCERCGGVYWTEECGRCQELDSWAAGMGARLNADLREVMRRGGMSPVELEADPARIPQPLAAALRPHFVATAGGQFPERGFGLLGGAGVGKTMAMACFMAQLLGVRYSTAIRLRDPSMIRFQYRWIPWPDLAAEIRLVSTKDGGMERVHEELGKLSRADVLVLDDLGAERIRENYTSDFAVGLLDVVVDRRSRNGLPTWWTSNMVLADLAGRYGSRFMSRLTGMGREINVPAMPDMRRRQA